MVVAHRHAGADLLAYTTASLRSWEQVTSLLTEALVARGIDVTLFATKDSRTTAKQMASAPRRIRGSLDRRESVGDASTLPTSLSRPVSST